MKLAVNRETQEAIAVKIIDLEKATEKDCYDNVKKEVSYKLITLTRLIFIIINIRMNDLVPLLFKLMFSLVH